jgi:hypothetical protein
MFSDITKFSTTGDWLYLVTAVCLVDFVVIMLAKYPGRDPYFKVGQLNEWYDRFGVFAVASDVLSILIGIFFARYIYSALGLNNPLYFVAILLAFQLAHDIFFYVTVIQQLPAGHNQMIDVFKAYGAENGAKILVSDALMMLGSVGVASYLKSLPEQYTIGTLFITLYSICYSVFTRTL